MRMAGRVKRMICTATRFLYGQKMLHENIDTFLCPQLFKISCKPLASNQYVSTTLIYTTDIPGHLGVTGPLHGQRSGPVTPYQSMFHKYGLYQGMAFRCGGCHKKLKNRGL